MHYVTIVLALQEAHFQHYHPYSEYVAAELVDCMGWLSVPLFERIAQLWGGVQVSHVDIVVEHIVVGADGVAEGVRDLYGAVVREEHLVGSQALVRGPVFLEMGKPMNTRGEYGPDLLLSKPSLLT